MYPDRKSRLCYQDTEKLSRDQYKDKKIRTPSGSYVKVTDYSDGTSKVHYGGPCGPVNYDSNGEEC